MTRDRASYDPPSASKYPEERCPAWHATLEARCARLVSQHEKLVAERNELKRYVDKLPTYCAYCGFEVPIDDEAASKISEHITTCHQHPMRHLERRIEKLVDVVRCLLLSADAAWEADAGGHDWPEACQLARALLKEETP